MRVIACANQKGGTAKTTTAVNLCAGLNLLGKKVLLIDLDPQTDLTVHLGINPKSLKYSVLDLLEGKADLLDVIQNTRIKGIDILPSHQNLTRFELLYANKKNSASILKERLSELSNYDFVLIDSPPSLGLLTVNGFTFANELIVPLQVHFFALYGMIRLLETITLVQANFNPSFKLTGIAATMYDNRTNLCQDVLGQLKKRFSDKLFKTVIRVNISLTEASSFGKTVFEHEKNSHGAEDYLALAKEVIKRG